MRLPAMGAVAVLALGGCGDDAGLEERLREIQEQIEQADHGGRDLGRRLACRDRHTGEPRQIQDCIDRGER